MLATLALCAAAAALHAPLALQQPAQPPVLAQRRLRPPQMQTDDLRRPGARPAAARPPSAIRPIGDVAELQTKIAASDERLMVVKFFAPWCRTCKSIKAKYEKLARERDDIAFYEVSFVAAKPVCKHCGITYLPTMHVYSKGELVGAPSVTLKNMPKFVDDVTKFEKELRGIYVPKNQCDDNYWTCAADEAELSSVDYDDDDGDGSAGAVGGPLGSRSETV